MPKTQTICYDNFSGLHLDSSKWTFATFPLADGNFWRWEEPEAKIKTGDGRLEITVSPYTRYHDQVQIFDNPKHLISGTRNIPVPEGSSISFSFKMGAITIDGDPNDFRDGLASFNVVDLTPGWSLTSLPLQPRFGVIYERLLMPGLTNSEEAFTEIVGLGPNQPGHLTLCRIDYDSKEYKVDYWLNGKKILSHSDLQVRPGNLFMEMGLITLRPIANGKSTSLRGQGGTGLWTDIKISVS